MSDDIWKSISKEMWEDIKVDDYRSKTQDFTKKEQRDFLKRIGICPRDFFTNKHKYKKGSKKLRFLPKRKRALVASATYNGS